MNNPIQKVGRRDLSRGFCQRAKLFLSRVFIPGVAHDDLVAAVTNTAFKYKTLGAEGDWIIGGFLLKNQYFQF